MDERMRAWLEQELKIYDASLQEYRKKVSQKAYLWMVLCVVGMVAFGLFIVIPSGDDISAVFRIHLPVGCGMAVFVWFCFWCQNKTTSIKKVRAAYEKGIAAYFKSEEDKEAFLHQMETNDYGRVSLEDITYNKYPKHFVAGPDYLMISDGTGCRFVKTADIENVYIKEESGRVRYKVGNTRVAQNMTMGYSLVMEYNESARSRLGLTKDDYVNIYMNHKKELDKAVELLRKYCPDNMGFM